MAVILLLIILMLDPLSAMAQNQPVDKIAPDKVEKVRSWYSPVLTRNLSDKTPDCYMISGFNRLDNAGKALESIMDLKEAPTLIHSFNGMVCTVVASWHRLNETLLRQELVEFTQAQLSNKSFVIKNKPIIVLQETHGGEGGCSVSDDADEGFGYIFYSMNHIARTRPLVVASQSCFSGDLLAKKLLYDEIYPDDKAIDNLCLFTASLFGTSATGVSKIHTLLQHYQPGKTFLSAFMAVKEVIHGTFAPWAESGVTNSLWGSYYGRKMGKHDARINDEYQYFNPSRNRPQPKEDCTSAKNSFRALVARYYNKGSLSVEDDEYQAWIVHRAFNYCSDIAELDKVVIQLKDLSNKPLSKTSDWSTVWNILKWDEYSYVLGAQPYEYLANVWAKNTIENPRKNKLDQRRYNACMRF